MQDGAEVVPATLPPAVASPAEQLGGRNADVGVIRLPLPGRRMQAGTDELSAAGKWAVPCYVAGPENRLVASVFERLLDEPTEHVALCSSSLLLVGPSGCGKTHLARGLAEAWNERLGHTKTGDSQVAYLAASDFRRQVAAAIAERTVDALRSQLRRCRLLVIDDLPRLAGEAYALEELIHTLDAIAEQGGLVIAATQKPLGDIPRLSRALAGRMVSGLMLEIAPPGTAAKQELLKDSLTALGCAATPRALRLLADHAPANPRLLLGMATRLRARLRAGATLDEDLAAELTQQDLHRPSPPASEIIAATARYYGLPKAKLTSSSRQKSIVLARAVAIYLTRELTPLSYDQIGKLLGGRDHTTVLHNHRRIERALPADRVLRHALDELRRSITAEAVA